MKTLLTVLFTLCALSIAIGFYLLVSGAEIRLGAHEAKSMLLIGGTALASGSIGYLLSLSKETS